MMDKEFFNREGEGGTVMGRGRIDTTGVFLGNLCEELYRS